jgi:hypothetical protein
MKFYTITVVSNYLERPLIRSFHAHMFHGLAERDGKEWPRDPHIWANTESASPLLIARTIHRVPEISEPGSHLVVSERLAGRLKDFQNIRLAPVVFKRLIDIEWDKGDMLWYEKWGSVDPRELLRAQPDVDDFHKQIGSFFEVQTHRWKDIEERYPSAKEVIIDAETPPSDEPETIRVSPEMLRDYPMLWWGSIILNFEVFNILDASLDRDFFIVRKYEVP